MILGVDVGNYYTKTSKGVIFPTRYNIGFDSMTNKNSINIIYKGEKYCIKNDAAGITDMSIDTRYNSLLHELCMLVAIAKSFPEKNIETSIVAGVPIEYLELLEDKVTNIIKSYSDNNIEYYEPSKDKFITKNIKINNVITVAQGAPLFLDPTRYNTNDISMVIDIGGGTIICTMWRGLEIIDHFTYPNGMMNLYSIMIKNVNKLGLGLLPRDAEDIFKENSFIIKKATTGKVYNIDFLKKHIGIFCGDLINNINSNFKNLSEKAKNVILIGGGSNYLYPYIKEYYKIAELFPESQFSNAKVFELIGNLTKIDEK